MKKLLNYVYNILSKFLLLNLIIGCILAPIAFIAFGIYVMLGNDPHGGSTSDAMPLVGYMFVLLGIFITTVFISLFIDEA